MKKRLSVLGFIVSLILVLFPAQLSAAYDEYLTITVSSNNTAAFSYMPVLVSLNNSQLSDYGYIDADGLNTNLLEGATSRDYAVYTNKTLLVIPSLAAGQQRTYQYQLGYTPDQTAFPFSTGYNGYLTISDDASLEPGNNFELEIDGYFDTSVTGNIISKTDAFELSVDGGEIAAELLNLTPAFPVVESTSTSTDTGSPFDVTMPSGVESGDLLLVVITSYDPNEAVLTPTGWTQLYGDLKAGNNLNSYCFYKYADGTEGATVEFAYDAAGNTAHVVYRISGATGAPEYAITAATSTQPNPPSLSPSWGSSQNLWVATAHMEYATVTGYPSGFTNTINADTGDGYSKPVVAMASLQEETATKDPSNFNYSGTSLQWQAATIAVQPATPSVSVSTTGVASGEHVFKVTADGTNLKLYIDGTEESSASLDGETVNDNANDWVLFNDNVTPYVAYYKHTVSSALKAWYQPNSMIIPSSLTDRSGNGNTGVMTLAGNHPSITITLGGIVASSTYTASTGGSEEGGEVVYSPGVIGFENTSATGSNLPYYTIFARAADSMGTSTLAVYGMMILFIALIIFVAVSISTSSQMLGLAGAGIVLGVGAAAIIGIWVVFIVILGGGMLLYVYRRT